jgi:hypothetical protein
LVLACKGKAFNIVAGTKDKDAHAAWNCIRDVKAPNKAKYLIKLDKQFTTLAMEDENEDPEIYITELEKINELYESIGMKHKKEDMDMIVQIFTVLPETYANPITSRETAGIENVPLKMWRRNSQRIGIVGSRKRLRKKLQIKHFQWTIEQEENLQSIKNSSKGLAAIVENKGTKRLIVGQRNPTEETTQAAAHEELCATWVNSSVLVVEKTGITLEIAPTKHSKQQCSVKFILWKHSIGGRTTNWMDMQPSRKGHERRWSRSNDKNWKAQYWMEKWAPVHNDCPTHKSEAERESEEESDDDPHSPPDEEDDDSLPPPLITRRNYQYDSSDDNSSDDDSSDDKSEEEDTDEDIPELCPRTKTLDESEPLQVNATNLETQDNMESLLDNGAAIHCVFSDMYMTNVSNPKKGNITVASGSSLNVKKVGPIHFKDEATKLIISLNEYHHVPGLTKEMISLGKLIGEKWIPSFVTEAIYLKKGIATVTCIRNEKDGMYYLKGKHVSMNEANAVNRTKGPHYWRGAVRALHSILAFFSDMYIKIYLVMYACE